MSKATQSNALSVIKDKWLDDPDKDQGIKTQFKTINLKLGRLRGFVCLQAIPKVGKSTLAMQLGVHVAQSGTPVYYIDFENGKVEVMKRVCQQLYEYEPHELKAKLKRNNSGQMGG